MIDKAVILGGAEITAGRALAAWAVLTRDLTLAAAGAPTLRERQAGLCYLCGEEMRPNAGFHRQATRDHVFPRRTHPVAGSIAQVALAHRICNQWKGPRPPKPCEVVFLVGLYLDEGIVIWTPEQRRRLKRARWKAMEAARQ